MTTAPAGESPLYQVKHKEGTFTITSHRVIIQKAKGAKKEESIPISHILNVFPKKGFAGKQVFLNVIGRPLGVSLYCNNAAEVDEMYQAISQAQVMQM